MIAVSPDAPAPRVTTEMVWRPGGSVPVRGVSFTDPAGRAQWIPLGEVAPARRDGSLDEAALREVFPTIVL